MSRVMGRPDFPVYGAHDKTRLVVMAGPTGVGKTATAVALAHLTVGEVVSADSMQVYRRLDIGTDKITPREMEGIAHHLLDVAEPWEEFSAARYQSLADQSIMGIAARGHLPLLVGGTGLYIRTVVDRWLFPDPGPQPELRQALQEEAAAEGVEHLHHRLAEVDPPSAARIHPRDLRRIIRALEVYESTGRPISQLQEASRVVESPYDPLFFGLTCRRDLLYARVDARVDRQIQRGLVEEVRHLAREGVFRSGTASQALGYKEILGHLEGRYDLDTAVAMLKQRTRHYVKRQYTWFRRDSRIRWLDVEEYGGSRETAAEIYREIEGRWGPLTNTPE